MTFSARKISGKLSLKAWNFGTLLNLLCFFDCKRHQQKLHTGVCVSVFTDHYHLCGLGQAKLYFTWLLYENAFFCVFTSSERSVVFDLTVCCHWSFNASDAEGAREMYTPRVGENTVYDSPLLSQTAPPTPFLLALCTAPKASNPPLLKNRLFKQICSWPWT